MLLERIVARAFLSAVMLMAAPPARAGQAEPLIVTPLADPDPNYALRDERRGVRLGSAQAREDVRIDHALQIFGRAVGESALAQQQQRERLCSAGVPTDATSEERFAYEASCRYSRH